MNRKADIAGLMKGPFHLGEWLVEPALNRVTKDGETIQLEQRVMGVLVCLAEHAGDLVTRRDIIDTVWDAGFVADNTITHAVTALRKAFGDDARRPQLIETIHRRGYRLIAPVIFDQPHPPSDVIGQPTFLALVRDLEIPLGEGENLIGRAPNATITVPSLKASRYHARITVSGTSAQIEDLDSKNGTFVNGSRIFQPIPLRGGDLIGIGCVTETIRLVDSPSGCTTEPEFDA